MGLFDWIFGSSEPEIKKPKIFEEILESGTENLKTPIDLFKFYLEKFEESGGEFITFHDKENDEAFIQVIYYDDANINFNFKFEEKPDIVLKNHGVKMPDGYSVVDWDKNTFATYAGEKISIEEMANLVDELFKKLLKTKDNYQVKGYIE